MAEINAVLAARDPGDRLQGWYACPYCDGFHLTSVPVAERTGRHTWRTARRQAR
jgi:hypothetical protein